LEGKALFYGEGVILINIKKTLNIQYNINSNQNYSDKVIIQKGYSPDYLLRF